MFKADIFVPREDTLLRDEMLRARTETIQVGDTSRAWVAAFRHNSGVIYGESLESISCAGRRNVDFEHTKVSGTARTPLRLLTKDSLESA